VRCLALGGGATPEGVQALAAVGVTVAAAHDGPIDLEAARAAGARPVEAAAERLARGVA
jgi:hypothetical protein